MYVVRFGNAPLIQSLTCNHEEAETRMLLHASHVAGMVSRDMITFPDTDVAVLLYTTELWFKTGVKVLVRYTPIQDLVVTKPVFGGLRTTKAQTSLRIRAD